MASSSLSSDNTTNVDGSEGLPLNTSSPVSNATRRPQEDPTTTDANMLISPSQISWAPGSLSAPGADLTSARGFRTSPVATLTDDDTAITIRGQQQQEWMVSIEAWTATLNDTCQGGWTDTTFLDPNKIIEPHHFDATTTAEWFGTAADGHGMYPYPDDFFSLSQVLPESDILPLNNPSLSSQSSRDDLAADNFEVSQTTNTPGLSDHRTPTDGSPWVITTPGSSTLDSKEFVNGMDDASVVEQNHVNPDTAEDVDPEVIEIPRDTKPPLIPIASNTPLATPTTTVLGPSKVWTLPPRIRRRKKEKPASEAPETKKRKKPEKDGLSNTKPPGHAIKKRGAYTDEVKKRNTALTRQLKSCIRCRMNRNRCLPDPSFPQGPCLTCCGMTGPTLCKMPCYRYIVTDASLYREQKAPWQVLSRRWQTMEIIDIPASDWASSTVRTIKVSPNHVWAPFDFEVREFYPREGDLLEEKWQTPTGPKRMPVPRYAVADMQATAERMKAFVDVSVWAYLNASLENMDPLLQETYLEAFRHIGAAKTNEEQSLLANTFRLWTVCRMTSNPVYICGEDQLDWTPVACPYSPHYGKVPMPLFMTAQFECINYTMFLRPWSKAVLKQLNDLVLAKKREYWFTIYCCMFVLLHSCSMTTRRDEETARQFEMKSRYANPGSIREHHAGAQTMLAHFHFINKGVLPFSLPKTPTGRKELSKAASLSDDQVEFVWRTADMVKDPHRAAQMRYARQRGEVGHDLYWVSMLFDQDWRPQAHE
ncbi:hypothetical protein QBC35DRAFT_58270 [Podospora australis]|uniref:Zn(2)-C6 fungal-type domain-containing protein n=1 Tax=Podospora australis TaxID=1536484 RepID=A0AAN6WN92_9PEZI|nr:hypothetical protein QBC35DRAFT_58270 [Podospora australis]